VDEKTIVAPTSILTPAIEALAAPGIAIAWEDSHAPVLFSETIADAPGALVSFGYQARFSPEGTIDINQLVLDTNRPIAAVWQYLRAQPGTFDTPAASSASFASIALDYRSPNADQQRAVCLQITPQRCQLAYVWARYGQYLVRVRIAAEQPLELSTIRDIFQQIDNHISQKLRERENTR
jgi:hypothetical protein